MYVRKGIVSVNRLLVTGATGFVGRWTLQHWRATHPDVEIWATSNQPTCPEGLADEFCVLDLLDAGAVQDLVDACVPGHVIHLAGLVGAAPFADHIAVNVLCTENLYRALSQSGASPKPRVVQAGTAALYGYVAPDELPVREDNPLRPLTAYGLSKMTQDYLAEMFCRTQELDIVRARVFNLMGPGQPEHLVPASFIKQLKAMHDRDSLQVGNLSARRDFVDVRDVVRAFDALLAGGQPRGVYNIASGSSVSIRSVLDDLLEISGLHDVSVEEDAARMRPNDVLDVYGDITAIAQAVGWRPQISREEALRDMWNEGGA